MNPFRIKNTYCTRFSFLGKQYRFSLRANNFKVANLINEQIKRGLERGIFNSFEAGFEGDRVLRNLIARPGLCAEEALDEINAPTKRVKLQEAIDNYVMNCKTEHTAGNYRNEERVFKDFAENIKVAFVHQVPIEGIEQWRNRRVEDVSKGTINRELKMIKTFISGCSA